MKKRTRVLSVLLAATMAFSAVGCGAKESGGENANTGTEGDVAGVDETGSEDSEVGQYTVLTDENGNPYDLGGMEIIIADWFTSEDQEISSEYDEARQDYLDWIQSTYNFTIKQQAVTDWGSSPEEFVNYATTGGDENYVFTLYQGSALTSALSSGLMYDLSTLDCLDFSESKWDSVIKDAMSNGDSVYAMRAMDHEPTAGIFFNKRILEDAGIDPESIYEMQRNNEWTWDKVEELCQQVQKDTNNDGVIDQYAMTNFTSVLYPAAVYSNGGEFIGKDENGFYNAL